MINGKKEENAETTKNVVRQCLENCQDSYFVIVKHRCDIPVGAGFGSSGSGALGCAFGLNTALGLNFTYDTLGTIAHVAEVESFTGLGTTGPLLFGRGIVLQIEGGAPNIMKLDSIPIPSDFKLVTCCYGPVNKKEILTNHEISDQVTLKGKETMKKILKNPTPSVFFKECRDFAESLPFLTDKVRNLFDSLDNTKVVGVAQNMIGEAAHVLVHKSKVQEVVKIWSDLAGKDKVLENNIEYTGPKIVSYSKE